MIQALYNGISGVNTQQFGVDVWSNNIANVNTIGFRSDTPTFQSLFYTALDGVNANSPVSNSQGYGSTVAASAMDTRVGSFKTTDEETFNMAVSENGWFTVGTKNGSELYYTRDGSFSRDSEGYLVNPQGFYLYGKDLGKVNGSVFTSDVSKNEALKASDVSAFQPLQVSKNIYFQPTETTYINAQLNLNSDQNIKAVSSAFASIVYNGDIQQIAQRDMGQFYDIKDGHKLSIGLLDASGNPLYGEDGELLKGEFTYRANPNTANNEFNTIQQLQDLINNNQRNEQIEFVLSLQDQNFVFKNVSGEEYIMDFTGSNTELLQAFSLPEKSKIGANGDSITTAPLYQKSFYEQDMNTIYNDSKKELGLLTNDDFGIKIDGGKKQKILYTNTPSDTNIEEGYFNTVKDFVTGLENLFRAEDGTKRVQVSLQDCRLILENVTDQTIDLEFTSTNVNLMSRFGLPTQVHLDPKGTTQTTMMQVPAYSTSHEMYDIDGKKYYLKTDFILKRNSELGTSNETWDSVSMIYALQNNALVSSDYTLGQIRFSGTNQEPKLYEVSIDGMTGNKIYTEKVYSAKDGINEKYLEVDFQGGNFAEGVISKSIKYNPTGILKDVNGVKVWDFSSTEKYMDSIIRNNEKNGNPEGFISNVVVDLNGQINFYFSNDVSEEFGRVGLVDFINPQGLEKVGSNLYRQTNNSSDPYVMWDNETGLLQSTTVMQGKLENSNVDMNVALTELIVMQRAYTANTKTITTADEMLQKAIDLKK